jgi:hypothetical protein
MTVRCTVIPRRPFTGARFVRMATRGPRGGPLLRGQADNHRRVVRGGAFNNNHRNARCAYRNRNDPHNLNRNQGFRPVVAHAFPNAGTARRGGPSCLPGRGLKNGAACSRPHVALTSIPSPEIGREDGDQGSKRANTQQPRPLGPSLGRGARRMGVPGASECLAP